MCKRRARLGGGGRQSLELRRKVSQVDHLVIAEKDGALDRVADLAAGWFARYLAVRQPAA